MSALKYSKPLLQRFGMGFLFLFFAASFAYAQSLDDSKQLEVTIVLSENGGPYAEFGNALDTLLSGRSVQHQVIDSTRPIPASGLVIGVGMKAATAVAASDAPSVLNVLITKASQNKLLRDFPRRAGSHTYAAIYLDQPIHRQVHLIAAIFPGKRNVGILYSTPPKELAQIRQEMNDHGLTLHEQAGWSNALLGGARCKKFCWVAARCCSRCRMLRSITIRPFAISCWRLTAAVFH